jgi:hypothetical protein
MSSKQLETVARGCDAQALGKPPASAYLQGKMERPVPPDWRVSIKPDRHVSHKRDIDRKLARLAPKVHKLTKPKRAKRRFDRTLGFPGEGPSRVRTHSRPCHWCGNRRCNRSTHLHYEPALLAILPLSTVLVELVNDYLGCKESVMRHVRCPARYCTQQSCRVAGHWHTDSASASRRWNRYWAKQPQPDYGTFGWDSTLGYPGEGPTYALCDASPCRLPAHMHKVRADGVQRRQQEASNAKARAAAAEARGKGEATYTKCPNVTACVLPNHYHSEQWVKKGTVVIADLPGLTADAAIARHNERTDVVIETKRDRTQTTLPGQPERRVSFGGVTTIREYVDEKHIVTRSVVEEKLPNTEAKVEVFPLLPLRVVVRAYVFIARLYMRKYVRAMRFYQTRVVASAVARVVTNTERLGSRHEIVLADAGPEAERAPVSTIPDHIKQPAYRICGLFTDEYKPIGLNEQTGVEHYPGEVVALQQGYHHRAITTQRLAVAECVYYCTSAEPKAASYTHRVSYNFVPGYSFACGVAPTGAKMSFWTTLGFTRGTQAHGVAPLAVLGKTHIVRSWYFPQVVLAALGNAQITASQVIDRAGGALSSQHARLSARVSEMRGVIPEGTKFSISDYQAHPALWNTTLRVLLDCLQLKGLADHASTGNTTVQLLN